VREYALWKAKTAALISRQTDRQIIEQDIRFLSEELMEVVSSYVLKKNKSRARDDLVQIFREAVALDEEMCKSRALYTAHHARHEKIVGREFDGNSMEMAVGSQPASPGMIVDLVMAPALTKTGTADGELYHTTLYISKWIVMCSTPAE
jgi:hypothetical protein